MDFSKNPKKRSFLLHVRRKMVSFKYREWANLDQGWFVRTNVGPFVAVSVRSDRDRKSFQFQQKICEVISYVKNTRHEKNHDIFLVL